MVVAHGDKHRPAFLPRPQTGDIAEDEALEAFRRIGEREAPRLKSEAFEKLESFHRAAPRAGTSFVREARQNAVGEAAGHSFSPGDPAVEEIVGHREQRLEVVELGRIQAAEVRSTNPPRIRSISLMPRCAH